MQIENAPILTIQHPDQASGAKAVQSVMASGVWQVHTLSRKGVLKAITRTLAALKKNRQALAWDLSSIERLDHVGAQMFWNAWGKQRPASLKLDPQHEELFGRIEKASAIKLPRHKVSPLNWLIVLGGGVLSFFEHLRGFISLIGQLILDIGRIIWVCSIG